MSGLKKEYTLDGSSEIPQILSLHVNHLKELYFFKISTR